MADEQKNNLSQEQELLRQTTAGLSDAQLKTLPPALRKEIEEINAAANVSDTENSETTTETPPESAQPDPEEKKDDQTDQQQREEDISPEQRKIQELSDELLAAQARYKTLQGKYNAETKALRQQIKTNTSDETDDDISTDTDDDDADTGEKEKSSTGSDNNYLKEFAEKHGMDADFVNDLAELIDMRNSNVNERISSIEAEKLNAELDGAIRKECFGLSLKEIGTHPLFGRYAAKMTDADGISAAAAIEEAKNRRDNEEVARITREIVSVMQEQNVWDVPGYSVKKAEPAEKTIHNVTPHTSGGVSNVQTARDVNVIAAELDSALAELRRGNNSAAQKVEKLKRELSISARKLKS